MTILNFLATLYPLLGTLLAGFFVLLFIAYLLMRTLRESSQLQKALAKIAEQEESERDYWRVFKYAAKKRIFRRAGHRCEWYDIHGGRCTATTDLEIDHIQPWSSGGWTLESNAQVLCHAHHLYKGGSVPTTEQITNIEERRKKYFAEAENTEVRWRPTDEERNSHQGKVSE